MTDIPSASPPEPAGPTLFQLAGGPPPAARLDEAAVLVIDAQEEYRTGALPLAGIDAALGRLAELLAAARAAGAPVFHIVHRVPAGGLFDLAGRGAVAAQARPLDGEAVVEKTMPSAFAHTDLEARLRATGRRKLIVAGFMTHMCVSTTTRAAVELGYAVTLAADATATRALPDPLGGVAVTAAELQRASLAALGDRFAVIAPVSALLAAGG